MTIASKIRMLAILATVLFASALYALSPDPLRPQPVETIGVFCHTGTVTTVCQNLNFVLEKPNGSLHFHFVQQPFEIGPGDVIEASGDLIRHDNGEIHNAVHHILRLGHTELPAPEMVPLTELTQRRDFLYRRLTTEGTLVLARQDEIDATYIQLLVKDGTTVLNAAVQISTNQPNNLFSLLGARIRLTGVLMKNSGARKNIANFLSLDPPGGFEVMRPPPADTFDVPELIFDSSWTPDEIVRMEPRRFNGVVMATWGGNQLMLAGEGNHRIRATLARDNERPTAGEHVAVVGFPDTDLYGLNLVYARCKPLPGKKTIGAEPKPIDFTLRQLLTDDQGRPRINGYSHGRLLRIKGTVLDVQPSLALFSLNEDKLTLPVDCSSSPDALPRLEENAKVEVVVLAITETDSWRESIVLPQTRGLKLILRSGTDLKILTRPPWWTPARLTAVVISLLVIIVLIIAANRIINRIMMRRKVSERTRLAVELHDSLSQTLAGVACQIAAGENAVAEDPEAAMTLLKTAERMLESSRTELKNCLFDLRNDTVDDPDFARAIAKTISLFKSETDISIRFHAARSQMTDTTAHAVLCIIRELVANAIRHGSATRIRIAGAADGGQLRFSVRDDGSGFDPKQHPGPREGHFGLAGIRERLASMVGKFSIESIPGKGTKATISLKLRPQRTGETGE